MSTVPNFFFKYRGYLPIPFALLVLLLSHPLALTLFLGTPLVLAGEILRIWAVGYAGPSTRSKSIEAKALATAGPYAHLRHPIYLGNFAVSLGFLICFNSWMPYMLIPFLLLFFLQYGFIVKAEEEYLRGEFGADYSSYAKQVPAFLPKLRAYPDKGPDSPHPREALRSESSTLRTIAGVYLLLLLRWLLRRYLNM